MGNSSVGSTNRPRLLASQTSQTSVSSPGANISSLTSSHHPASTVASTAAAQLASITSFIQQYGNSAGSSTYSSLLNHHNHHLSNSEANMGAILPVSVPPVVTTSNTLPVSNANINLSNQQQLDQSSSFGTSNSTSSTQITNNSLTRVFSILLKMIRELMNCVDPNSADNVGSILKDQSKMVLANEQETRKAEQRKLKKLIYRVNQKLESPWNWLVSIMDATEAQLRFGSSLNGLLNDSSSASLLDSQHQTQYLRHLEEKALLSNYYNSGSYVSGSLASNVGGSGTSGLASNSSSSYTSSRFGSGIDARRKLNIMQHQHLQYVNSSISNVASNASLISSSALGSQTQSSTHSRTNVPVAGSNPSNVSSTPAVHSNFDLNLKNINAIRNNINVN